MSNKPIYILGTGLSHDGSACLLKDGKIVVAIEKERITRIKHDGANDNDAIMYCLSAEGINLTDLSLIVQTGMPFPALPNSYNMYNQGPYGERIIDKIPHNVPIVTISHHLAHAYCAAGTAPFDEMSILVIDGVGQDLSSCTESYTNAEYEAIPGSLRHLLFEKDSFYHYKNGKMTAICKDFSAITDLMSPYLPMFPSKVDHSIGGMFEAASKYCIGSADDSGKLMGLAPYGTPGIYNQEIFDLKDGRVFVKKDWQKNFNRPFTNYEDFKSNFQYYADIAFWVQKETERAIIYLVNERAKLSKSKNLAFTGGVALNAVCNGKLLSASSFEKLYLTPAAGDNGIGMGCAFYGWLEIQKGNIVKHDGNSCFGKVYSKETILKDINNFKITKHVDSKRVVEDMFKAFPSCTFEDRISQFCILQFIIPQVGMYAIEFKDHKCTVIPGAIEMAHATITVDAKSFIKLMLDFNSTLPSMVRSRTMKLEGNIPYIAEYLNTEALSGTIKKIIGFDENERVIYSEETDIVKTTAQLLAEGKVIGWFQGGSEFGPRALGHRSILADPRKKDIQKFINSEVKFREDFRPFAPAVLLEDVSEYFQYEGESPYMILVAQVQPKWKEKIPGVVHKDGSCRIQTVTPDWNFRFESLLREFKKITGTGVLLNTSFNRKGMPIVETPLEALSFFYECGLDCLIIGDFLIYKEATHDKIIDQDGTAINAML